MKMKKIFLTLLIATMVLNKSHAAAACNVPEYDNYSAGCGYNDCRKAACLMVGFAWGVAIFAGMYLIILNDGNCHGSHTH